MSQTPLQARQAALEQEFSVLPTWEDKYQYLIKIGRELPSLAENEKTEDNRVRGCQSQVWLVCDLDSSGHIMFRADSDAMLVKGLVAILLQVYSNSLPEEILTSDSKFLTELGLTTHLSPSRTNGLHAMLKRIHYTALAYSMKK